MHYCPSVAGGDGAYWPVKAASGHRVAVVADQESIAMLLPACLDTAQRVSGPAGLVDTGPVAGVQINEGPGRNALLRLQVQLQWCSGSGQDQEHTHPVLRCAVVGGI